MSRIAQANKLIELSGCVSAFLWTQIEQRLNTSQVIDDNFEDELCEKIRQEFAGYPQELSAPVTRFIEQLQEAGLIPVEAVPIGTSGP